MRPLRVLIAFASSALLLAACGGEGISVPKTDAVAYQGAQLFATHCAGCHTISAAGTQGSGNRNLRAQGPNFNQRQESYDDALFAMHNGGFSGAIMPQNILAGDDADKVAEFLAKYSGTEVVDQPRPPPSSGSETGESNAVPNETAPDASAGGGSASQSQGGSGTPGGGAGSTAQGQGQGQGGGGSQPSNSN